MITVPLLKTEDSSVLHIPKYDFCSPCDIQGKKVEKKRNEMSIKIAFFMFNFLYMYC